MPDEHGARDGIARTFTALGLGPVSFFPPRRSTALPTVGPNTLYILAQPFLADTARALEERGAKRIPAPFPLGVEGTTAWIIAAAASFGISSDTVLSVTALEARRKAHFLFPGFAARNPHRSLFIA